MGFIILLELFLISALCGGVLQTHAWGKEGHFMVCKIAEAFLTEETMGAVQELLPKGAGGKLASVCSWADKVRSRYPWANPLHYANTPEVCNFQYKRDCNYSKPEDRMCVVGAIYNYAEGDEGDCHYSKPKYRMCVVGAINNYTDQLKTYWDFSTAYNLTESLMFLAHFMGDIHQPLHVGFKKDKGGTGIRVRWLRRKKRTNLHHVWDVDIIETAKNCSYANDLNEMISSINRNITDDEVLEWDKCTGKQVACPNKYASESVEAACQYAYEGVTQKATLQDDYFRSRLPIVEKRIAQAGVRLASVLNQIFNASAAGDLSTSMVSTMSSLLDSCTLHS